jgi:hypothetical protein
MLGVQQNEPAISWPVLNDQGDEAGRALTRRLGINFGPACIILGRDGRLAGVPLVLVPQQIERIVREELGLPAQ